MIESGIYAFKLFTEDNQLLLEVDCFNGIGGISDGEYANDGTWWIYCRNNQSMWETYESEVKPNNEKFLDLMGIQLTEDEYRKDYRQLVDEGFFED